MNCRECLDLLPLCLSGELDALRTDSCRAHFAGCASCCAEFDRMAEVDSRIRTAISSDTLDTAALDRQIRRQIAASSSNRWRKWSVAAAGIAAALMLGIFSYRTSNSADPACVAALTDHQREVVNGVHRTWLVESAAVQSLAAKQGIDTSVIDRLRAAGLHLQQGKLCRLDGHPFLHLVYSKGAETFSVFLRQHSGSPRAIQATDGGSGHASSFETAHVTAIVVGHDSAESVRRLAQLAQAVL